jgi:L-alanine-DL-glutamate epimerase-like enolase superfamily enzyme
MATIDRIELSAFGPDMRRTTWASMPPQYMTLVLARVWDSDGAEGVAATQTYAPGAFDLSAYEAARILGGAIVGKPAADREARWRDLRSMVLAGPAGAASVLDNALWDLAARRAGLPLYQFLGASRHEIAAYASTEELPRTADYLDLVERLAGDGYKAIKFHAWNRAEQDLEMLRAVGNKFGGASLELMHDAENRYNRNDAIRVAQELEQLGYRWFEAPLIDFDVEGYRAIRERSRIPLIPHGLWITDVCELLAYLRHSVWDAVRFDTCSAVGITQARKLCALAEAFGLPVEPQSWGYSLVQAPNLHLALSVAAATFFELPVPLEAYEYGVENPIRLQEGGVVSAPSGAGIGLTIEWDRIAGDRLARCDVLASVAGGVLSGAGE